MKLLFFVETRQQRRQVAWLGLYIEPRLDDLLPGSAAGAGGSWQTKKYGRIGNPGQRPGLDGGGANLVEGKTAK